jgi:hypothetical protein
MSPLMESLVLLRGQGNADAGGFSERQSPTFFNGCAIRNMLVGIVGIAGIDASARGSATAIIGRR